MWIYKTVVLCLTMQFISIHIAGQYDRMPYSMAASGGCRCAMLINDECQQILIGLHAKIATVYAAQSFRIIRQRIICRSTVAWLDMHQNIRGKCATSCSVGFQSVINYPISYHIQYLYYKYLNDN